MTTWEQHTEAWSRLPVDDYGYFSSKELLQKSDNELRKLVAQIRNTRYKGWRNHGNKWRDLLGLESLEDKTILDFGCGIPVDSLELALAGNTVSLADLSKVNLELATRVFGLHGVTPESIHLITEEYPFVEASAGSFDVFFCNGVLHHSRVPQEIMKRAHELLTPTGEVRLMVYSDRGWEAYIGTTPPEDIESDLNFQKFVNIFDQTGDYADWYDKAKLESKFGSLFNISRFDYITDNDRYLAAVLKKKVARKRVAK